MAEWDGLVRDPSLKKKLSTRRFELLLIPRPSLLYIYFKSLICLMYSRNLTFFLSFYFLIYHPSSIKHNIGI